MLKKDTVLVSESNRKYTVHSLISSGTGQADIYKVIGDGVEYALKLFYVEDFREMKRQIQVLMKRGKACPEYVHPLDSLVIDDRLGYIMEYIPDTYVSGSVLYNGMERDGYREELPFHVKISVLHSLAEAMSVLYNANLAIMDLKFDNLKINPEDWSVKILDTDTVVASDDGKSLIEGTVGFMPPLTMRREEVPNKHNDSFALAVMIFMSLLGSHPLVGALWDQPQSCDIETYAFAENPIYVWHPTDTRNRPGEEGMRTVSKLLKYPKRFLDAMERAFVDGLFEREKRPSPGEWADILKEVYEGSYCCVECGEEHFFSEEAQMFCDGCDQELVKPLLLQGEKRIPLFFGAAIAASELWSDRTSVQPFVRVVSTRYRGKCGLLVEGEAVTLRFSAGEGIEFCKGKIVPLFMNAAYEYQNKSFIIKES